MARAAVLQRREWDLNPRCPEAQRLFEPRVIVAALANGESGRVAAEGVGFEPTVPGGTTVFETVRFGRSRIPPEGSLPVTPFGEEGCQEGTRPLGQHAARDRDLVVEAGVGAQVVEGAAGAGAGVGCAED